MVSRPGLHRAQGLTVESKARLAQTRWRRFYPPRVTSGREPHSYQPRCQPPFLNGSDETGNLDFEPPAGAYIVSDEAKGLLPVQREIDLTTGAALVVDIILAHAVSESVTIREEEGLLSAGESTTSNTIHAAKLEQLPLRADNYQGAVPLTPSIIRDSGGADHIKGTRAGDNAYTVNGADVTDPVTGNLAFAIPLEAAASVRVEDNPYSTEFGKATGGVSTLETKTGGDEFKFRAARVFPTFHNITGADRSVQPRGHARGPLIVKAPDLSII